MVRLLCVHLTICQAYLVDHDWVKSGEVFLAGMPYPPYIMPADILKSDMRLLVSLSF